MASRKFETPVPPCIDRGRELRAAAIAALGGNPQRRHFACKTGEHPFHALCSKR